MVHFLLIFLIPEKNNFITPLSLGNKAAAGLMQDTSRIYSAWLFRLHNLHLETRRFADLRAEYASHQLI